jgi:hypothetical protein
VGPAQNLNLEFGVQICTDFGLLKTLTSLGKRIWIIILGDRI